MENTKHSNSNIESSEDSLRKGNALHDQGKYEEAIRHYDETINLDANNVTAYHYRGVAKGILGQYSESIADFNTAIRLVSNEADSLL